MRITQIKVGYAETHSMPEYNNVRPSVELVVEFDGLMTEAEMASIEEKLDFWMDKLKKQVHNTIDETLEINGQSPHYNEADDLLFRIKVSDQRNCLAVVEQSLSNILPHDFRAVVRGGHYQPRRYPVVKVAAEKMADEVGLTLVYISHSDDFERLPPIITEEEIREELIEQKLEELDEIEIPF